MLIKDFGARVLCATPSYALAIAEVAEKEGVDLRKSKLRIGLFGAEPWSEAMRNEVEIRLGLKAVDIYGLSEIMGPGVACECEEAQAGLHGWEDHFIFEVIDPDTGKPVAEGEQGELVITTLTKEALPMIRYRTRDITRVSTERCDCGRTHLRIRRITGRNDDMLIIRGVNVYPSQIEAVLVGMPEIAPHYQLVVERKGNARPRHGGGRGGAGRRARLGGLRAHRRRGAPPDQVDDRRHHRGAGEEARRNSALHGQGGARARPAAEASHEANCSARPAASCTRSTSRVIGLLERFGARRGALGGAPPARGRPGLEPAAARSSPPRSNTKSRAISTSRRHSSFRGCTRSGEGDLADLLFEEHEVIRAVAAAAARAGRARARAALLDAAGWQCAASAGAGAGGPARLACARRSRARWCRWWTRCWTTRRTWRYGTTHMN